MVLRVASELVDELDRKERRGERWASPGVNNPLELNVRSVVELAVWP